MNDATLRWLLIATLGVGVLGWVAAFHGLGTESIWYDEAVSIDYARRPLASAVDAIAGRDTNGSLYYIILRGWVAIVGHGEGQVRALSAFLAVASLPVMVAIGARLARPWTGIGGALLLAASYMFAAYAREARMYALAMFLATASMYVVLVAAERRRLRWMVAYGLVAGLGVYAHLFMLPIVAAQALWLVRRAARGRDRWLWKQAAVAIGTASLITLPLAPFLVAGNTTAWIMGLSAQTLTWTFLALAGSSPLMLTTAIGLLMAAAYLWLRERPRSDGILLLLMCATLPIAFGIAISIVKPALVPRYFIVAMPAICLAIAYAVSRLRPAPLAIALFAVVLVIDGATGVSWHQHRQKDDWREATQVVSAWAGPGDRVAFYLAGSALPFAYYVERLGLESDAPALVDFDTLEDCGPGCVPAPRVWLVLNYQWTGQTPPELAALMDRLESAGYRGRGRDREVGGVKIRMMVRAEGGGR